MSSVTPEARAPGEGPEPRRAAFETKPPACPVASLPLPGDATGPRGRQQTLSELLAGARGHVTVSETMT